ncbi:VanZ family protein [Tersicoccus sp. Bi-70]|uniref:VanZ family protein n=1 Tax=Tersicoccus sp. Bi-70 TaxID=1897634 RepID=UPI00130109CB|nr:VanZ family protein [Tersicoccus sp. Bi-70]
MPSRPDAGARLRAARHSLAVLLAIAYGGTLAFLTLRPERADAGIDASLLALLARLRAAGWSWAEYGAVEWLANIALFVPAGLFLALVLPPLARWWGVAIGAVASGAIETAQALFLPTRVASLADVAANTLGSALGVAVVVAGAWAWTAGTARRRRRTPALAARPAGGAPPR